jgi:iron complex transport system substrate-binding protein
VVTLDLGHTLDDVPRQIAEVARLLGVEARGAALIAAYRKRLAAVPPMPPGRRPVAVLYEPNCITSGADSLPGAVLAAAGFANLAARRGIHGVGRLSLESVVQARPDALILGRLEGTGPSLAATSLSHPALHHAVGGDAVISMPHNLWACPIPAVATAVERLARFREQLDTMQRARR